MTERDKNIKDWRVSIAASFFLMALMGMCSSLKEIGDTLKKIDYKMEIQNRRAK